MKERKSHNRRWRAEYEYDMSIDYSGENHIPWKSAWRRKQYSDATFWEYYCSRFAGYNRSAAGMSIFTRWMARKKIATAEEVRSYQEKFLKKHRDTGRWGWELRHFWGGAILVNDCLERLDAFFPDGKFTASDVRFLRSLETRRECLSHKDPEWRKRRQYIQERGRRIANRIKRSERIMRSQIKDLNGSIKHLQEAVNEIERRNRENS